MFDHTYWKGKFVILLIFLNKKYSVTNKGL